MHMNDAARADLELGELLQTLVNRVAHRGQGKSFAIMSEASVTVPQMILLHRMIYESLNKPSELARSLGMSAPSASQMLDRLFQLDLIARIESPEDRRQRLVEATAKGKALAKKVVAARNAEYAQGVARLPAPLRAELKNVLARVVAEFAIEDQQREREPA